MAPGGAGAPTAIWALLGAQGSQRGRSPPIPTGTSLAGQRCPLDSGLSFPLGDKRKWRTLGQARPRQGRGPRPLLPAPSLAQARGASGGLVPGGASGSWGGRAVPSSRPRDGSSAPAEPGDAGGAGRTAGKSGAQSGVPGSPRPGLGAQRAVAARRGGGSPPARSCPGPRPGVGVLSRPPARCRPLSHVRLGLSWSSTCSARPRLEARSPLLLAGYPGAQGAPGRAAPSPRSASASPLPGGGCCLALLARTSAGLAAGGYLYPRCLPAGGPEPCAHTGAADAGGPTASGEAPCPAHMGPAQAWRQHQSPGSPSVPQCTPVWTWSRPGIQGRVDVPYQNRRHLQPRSWGILNIPSSC
ncbi:collagen alpha-1(I) chain-like isoform X2 [Equus quagga]|uniref:collagen alpha-1(I) chain-like isoform X2 n=1 Tax=Equus quagga TaxID=89248 RepID=UPI001EE1AE4D|nr:collagen alpha-1(I) chain-like isoform X2 [Equus quagga]